MKQEAYLLAVHRQVSLTFRRFQVLEKWCNGEWEKVYKAKLKQVQELGLDQKALLKWDTVRCGEPQKEWEAFQKTEAEMLLYGSSNYPTVLLTIPSPPPILFVKGKLLPEDFPCLGVVGSRKVSEYGQQIVKKFVPPLVQEGLTIVSGFALGVDILAHKEAYESGGRTIGVLGCGIDHVYPSGHSAFAKKLLDEERGVLVSEYLPGVRAQPRHFPVRNRIISGLSQGVLVVQSGQKSGSLITARIALDQGKEVMAVPGSVFEKQSAGCHLLFQRGEAGLVSSPEEILECLGHDANLRLKYLPTAQISGNEQQVLTFFSEQSVWGVDELARAMDLSQSGLSATLTLLEMKGLLCHLGQHRFGLRN